MHCSRPYKYSHLLLALFLVACTGDTNVSNTNNANDVAVDRGADVDVPDAAVDDTNVNDDATIDLPTGGTPIDITVSVTADRGASDGVISFAVPMKPGVAYDIANIRLSDAGVPVPAEFETLATWPSDKALRSVLIKFNLALDANTEKELLVQLNQIRDRSTDLSGLEPNPDGPVVAVLPAEWYADSRVVTAPMQAAAASPYQAYETEMIDNLFTMDPAYESYGVSCGSTSSHRTYYDGPRAIYTLFLRTGDPKLYRRARAEAIWYRENELLWNADRSMSYHICQNEGWMPDERLSWSVLRRMTGQGMLDDYLLSGDREAKEATIAMGNAFVANLPALRNSSGNDPFGSLQATERNLAWPMMGIASAFAISGSATHREALISLMDEIVEWQNRGTSGALEHDIVRPDPSECSDGPAGASPFMTTLVVDALMDYYYLIRDRRTPVVVEKIAKWMHNDGLQSNGQTWRYLWNCVSDSYDDGGFNDLNMMMVHVYGASYVATGDPTWIERGDALVEFGLADMFTRRPKQWNQSSRTFGKYLGYRVADPTAERAGEIEIPGPVPK